MWVFWNWKSALLSVMLRVPVFAVAAARHGLEAVAAAVLTESVVCGFNAGCYAAVVQAIRNRKPVWLTALLITVGMPAVGQVIEYEVHLWRMKHGTLLVGGQGGNLSHDLRRLPTLLGRFLLLGPRWVLRRIGWMALPSS